MDRRDLLSWQVELLSNPNKPIFSNLVELDSGLVIAGNMVATSNGTSNSVDLEDWTDLYRPSYNVGQLRTMLEHSIEEYNKTFPRIRLALYRVSITRLFLYLVFQGQLVTILFSACA